MRQSYWPVLLAVIVLLAACGPSAARYNNQGNEDYEAGEYDEALEDYTLAQRENPDLAHPYYNAGNTYYRQGDLRSANNQIQQSLRTAEEELSQQSYYNLGNTYFQAQDWVAAIEAYKQALRLDPDDIDAKNNLELALQMLQQQQQQPQQQQQNGQEEQNQQPPQENQGQGQQQEQQQQSGGQDQQEEQQQGQGEQEQNEQQPEPGPERLSPEEAEQLLDALGQESQTLQERLQQQFSAEGLPPVQDW